MSEKDNGPLSRVPNRRLGFFAVIAIVVAFLPAPLIVSSSAKSESSRFEGKWLVETIPTEPCKNPGGKQILTVDQNGKIVDLCVWNETRRRCGPSLKQNIRDNGVSASGDILLYYRVVPRVDALPHVSALSGNLEQGGGTFGAMRTHNDLLCPTGKFTIRRSE